MMQACPATAHMQYLICAVAEVHPWWGPCCAPVMICAWVLQCMYQRQARRDASGFGRMHTCAAEDEPARGPSSAHAQGAGCCLHRIRYQIFPCHMCWAASMRMQGTQLCVATCSQGQHEHQAESRLHLLDELRLVSAGDHRTLPPDWSGALDSSLLIHTK